MHIDGSVGLLTLAGGGEFDGGDDVDEFAEALLVEAGGGAGVRQRVFFGWTRHGAFLTVSKGGHKNFHP